MAYAGRLLGIPVVVVMPDTAPQVKIEATRREIYGNLSAWQRVQIARHVQRPFALDYIDRWSLGLDLKILLRTIPAVITGSGAK